MEKHGAFRPGCPPKRRLGSVSLNAESRPPYSPPPPFRLQLPISCVACVSFGISNNIPTAVYDRFEMSRDRPTAWQRGAVDHLTVDRCLSGEAPSPGLRCAQSESAYTAHTSTGSGFIGELTSLAGFRFLFSNLVSVFLPAIARRSDDKKGVVQLVKTIQRCPESSREAKAMNSSQSVGRAVGRRQQQRRV